MIVVEVSKSSITVNGHAGYAEAGHDIVCAAVSALTQTLETSLQVFTNDRTTREKRDGYMRFEYKDLSERGQLLVDSFFIGICGIANAYPDYLTIKEVPNGR